VARAYGVLNPLTGLPLRTTFVIDPQGRVRSVEQGSSAIDVSRAVAACEAAR
jgi:alkyl hydroperoxide reductase subunit AhpC